MPTSENYRDLFVHAVTPGKLDLFQSLLDTKELTFEEALALLSAVHVELEKPKSHPASMYMRYAETIEAFHQQMPDVHDQVVDTWRAKRGIVVLKANSPQELLETKPKAAGGLETVESERFVEDSANKIEKDSHPATHSTESKEESETEAKEGGEEEHEEPEEHAEEEKEESEEESKGEREENEEGEEKEEAEELEKEPEEEEEKEAENEERVEEKDAEEESEKETIEETESEESHTEEPQAEENEYEPETELETEAEDASETSEVEEAAESDHMAGEAAEAAHEAEHVELEIEESALPGEEEPPMEAGE